MKIIVVGCGKIGTHIIKNLVSEGHDLVAVDSNPDIISHITNAYDVMGVCGNSVDSETLEEAGVSDANLFIAMTGSDEFNMLSCFIAKKMGAKNTIARIRNPEYNDNSLAFLKQNLEISMAINPELMAAKEMYNMLKLPASVKVENFSRKNLELIELRITPEMNLDGVMVMKLREKIKASFLICAVQREDTVYVPDGHFILKNNDKIGITASPSEVLKLLRILGIERKQAKSVMILGGSKTAYYLAKMITNVNNTVKIIEKNEKRCDELSNELPKAMVILADGSQQEVLLEEGIEGIDAFVALTGMDEQNILICTYAKTHNVPKVITKINREELFYMAEKMGVEGAVSTKDITSNILVSYARALRNSLGSNVETLYKIMDGNAEALEFNVSSDSKVINIPLKSLHCKPNLLIAGITRGKKTILPSGDDVIMPNDRVVVLAANQRLNDLDDIILK
jgi:trk system potassium uptake protein TrkA